MENFNSQDLNSLKAKLSQVTRPPGVSFDPKANRLDGSVSKKSFTDKEYIKALSREELEQIVLSQGQQTSISSLSSLYSMPSQMQSRNSVVNENGFDAGVSSVKKISNVDQNSLLNYPPYMPHAIHFNDRSNTKSMNASAVSFDANATASVVDATNQQFAPDKSLTKDVSDVKRNSNVSSTLLGYSLSELGNPPQTLLQHPVIETDQNKRSISPFRQGVNLEKENYEATTRVEHVSIGSYLGSNREMISNSLPLQSNGHIVVKNIRNEANSAAYTGAMKALQEKLKKLEVENEELKKELGNKGVKNDGWVYRDIQKSENEWNKVIEDAKTQSAIFIKEKKSLFNQKCEDEKDSSAAQITKLNEVIGQLRSENENLRIGRNSVEQARNSGFIGVDVGLDKMRNSKKELEIEQKKVYELEKIKVELYNSKMQAEARLEKVMSSVGEREKVFQDRIMELEGQVKALMQQNETYVEEMGVITRHSGKEKMGLNEALGEIRAMYNDRLGQANAKIEALMSERKKMKKTVKAQSEENKMLQIKVETLEMLVQSSQSGENRMETKDEVFEQLKKINNNLLSKTKDSSNLSIPAFEETDDFREKASKKKNLKAEHHRSASDLSTGSQGILKASARSKSPSKGKCLLSSSYSRPQDTKENDYDLSFSCTMTSSPRRRSIPTKKSRKSSNKKKATKSKTPDKRTKKESKDTIFFTSRNSEVLPHAGRSNSTNNTFRHLSPNQTRTTLPGYSILTANDSSNKKIPKTARIKHSPKFSDEASLVKAKAFCPRSVSTERSRGDKTLKSIAKLETEIGLLKKDHKNMLINQALYPSKAANKADSLKKLLELIDDKSNSLAMLKGEKRRSSSKKKMS